MEYLLSLLWAFIEVAYFIVLNNSFLQIKLKGKKLLITYIITSIVLDLIANICVNQGMRLIISYICYILFSLFLFQGNIVKHILIAVICFIFSGIIDSTILYGACLLLKTNLAEFMWRKLAYITVVTTGKMIALLVAWIVYKARRRKMIHTIRMNWLLLTVIFPCVSLAMLSVVYISFQSHEDLSTGAFVFSIGLAVSNVAILYLIHKMELQTQNEYEVVMLNQQMQIQTESIIALEKSYRAQRQSTHEFRHHMDTINELLATNKLQVAKDYLLKIQETQATRILCINSNHPIVDVVANQKYQTARDHDIDVLMQVNDLSNINIETDALVVLLSNLFDNAIEACQQVANDRAIHCRILAGETVFISIRNTSNPVILVGDSIPSSKLSAEEHGYGLLNIKRILNKLKAEYTYAYNDGWFEFVIEIP